MAASNYEMNSFMYKFRELWGAGLEAHLNMDSWAGNAWMNLSVNLGPFQSSLPLSQKHHRSPSRIKRREKRAASSALNDHLENSAEEARNRNDPIESSKVENVISSTLIEDKVIAVNSNQESGLLVDNAEEVLIEDHIDQKETSDSNLVVQLIDNPVKCPENDTVETNKEDVKMILKN